jgi:cytochrome c oxidase subunit 2
MHIDRYEKYWIYASIAVLVVFAVVVGFSSFAYGIQVPVPEQRVDPKLVATPGATSFKEPGLYELAPNRFEAYIIGKLNWQFEPNEITVPVGSRVTFYMTSNSVIHGFKLEGTNLNVMLIPGEISKLTATFDEPGTYNFICHEYCGTLHHAMYGQVIVED